VQSPKQTIPRPVLVATATLGAATLVVGLVAVVIGTRPAAATSTPHADSSVAGTALTVGTDTCAAQWQGGKAGPATFAFWNNSIEGLEVYLEDTATHKVYLDVENLGAGSTRAASATLPAGRYRFLCLPSDADPVEGTPRSISGTTTDTVTPGVVPVTDNELDPALKAYESWIRKRLPGLLADVRALDADVRRGDLSAARASWLRGHTRYETLGAAYGAFGDDDTRIDALPSTTLPARRDRGLHGFHRIEALLWSGAPASAIAPETARLVNAVAHLRADLRTPTMNTVDIGLRSHEILENALEFELSGRDDSGSHSELATIAANLVGTRAALAPIRHLLVGRDPQLATTYTWLARTQHDVRSLRHGSHWIALDALTRPQRERLDADLSQSVELLSRVAVITDPRRVAQP